MYVCIDIDVDVDIDIASLVAQMVKNLPAVQETQVQSLGREDPPEKGMATHFSFLAWRIPWTEEPGWLQSIALQSQTWLSIFHFIADSCCCTAETNTTL